MTTTPVSRMLYPYSWNLAVRANQQRYPTHDRVPILKSSEIILDETYLTRKDLEDGVYTDARSYSDGKDQELLPGGEAPEYLEWPPQLCPPADTVAVVTTDPSIQLFPPAGVRRIVRRCRLKTPAVARTALRLSEMVIRHESWIDVERRELRIVTLNETWSSTAMLGDITIYRGITDLGCWRGKAPVAPLGTDHKFVGNLEQAKNQGEWCLFTQYAYFKISPTLNVPFRSAIEKKCLQCYHSNTQEGRKLDMEFMQEYGRHGPDKC
ncbi:hypothetical protein BJV82DRAFT_621428 [Fennellomyces sp. T-0311]|nr:hypothetical protein BJV82DRAFT_621428 [Fennellomyces sp. T-0311]